MKSRGLISPRETNGFATQEHHGDSIQEAVKRRPEGLQLAVTAVTASQQGSSQCVWKVNVGRN
jgi:hypothetical protein